MGPSEGTRASDDLWVARYILYRMSEEFGLVISLAPKPLPSLSIGACGGHSEHLHQADEGGWGHEVSPCDDKWEWGGGAGCS